MSSYKEIVTKAVIGKGKKNFVTKNFVKPDQKPSTILGCWVINHSFKGYTNNNKIIIEGEYDVNIWYSCQNDTKTEVIRQSDKYKEVVNIPVSSDYSLDGTEEVIIRSLNQPSCIKTEIDNGKISYTIEKELGIEIVGDTKVKIAIDDEEDAWEDIIDDDVVDEKIDKEVNENFID